MILQFERQVAMSSVSPDLRVRGSPKDLLMILHNHAVLNDRYIGRLDELFTIELRRLKMMSYRCHSPGLQEAFTSGGYCP